MARAKQTKAAAKPAETTAQEYFLSYYKPVYPTDCRDIWFMDTDGIELQRGKSCFTTEYAPDPDYEGQCKRRVICGIHSECHRCKYICITYRCPEQQGVLTYRCSIGNLTDEEKDLLLKNIDILQEDGFDLSPLAIDTLTLEEHFKHQQLLKRFRSYVRQNDDDSISAVFADSPFYTMVNCFNLANEIRKLRKQTSPEPAVDRQMPAEPAVSNVSTVVTQVLMTKEYADYQDKREKQIADWDYNSRTKYKGTGWTTLARIELEKNGQTQPKKSTVENKAKQIENAVKAFRERRKS